MLELALPSGTVSLYPEDLLIETTQTPGYYTVSDHGITVAIDTTLTPELVEEGFVRELVSKLQTMRKEAGFEVMDTITVYADGNEKLQKLMEKNADSMLSDVMATALHTGTLAGYQKTWNVNGEEITLGVEKNA